MNKILKFTKEQAENMVFMSDLHRKHDRDFVWGVRGFEDKDTHWSFIKDQWNEDFNEDTIIMNLGDVCFGDARMEAFGNHNSGVMQAYKMAKAHAGYPENVEVYPIKHNKVTFCGEDLVIRVGKKEIHMSHFAKKIWDHVGYGSWHLSGHSHGNDWERNVESNTEGKCFDVGVDNALKYRGKFYFTYQDILDIMEKKDIVLHDHHDDNTNQSR